MKTISIYDLINKIEGYEREITAVIKAYEYAKKLHEGQMRQSGEPYITHPLNVAYILAEMHADIDTICAALLHDTLEDTIATKQDIIETFNPSVANLVDGVTKISNTNFSSKNDLNMANTRKIIVSLTEDVRIVIIKLADRLHNMRTLQYKTEFKQKENALETIEIFAPLAYYIGAYKIKGELEDLSLKYLKPDTYKNIEEIKQKLASENEAVLNEMIISIKSELDKRLISNIIKIRIKNAYGINKELSEKNKLSDIHDLLSIMVVVDNVENCYGALGLIHNKYHPLNDKFKDYICNKKPNMYQSLHTTVFGPNDKLVQTQIRTYEMDKTAEYGLTAYWEIYRGQARINMQEDFKNKYQFFKSLQEINYMFSDNQDFVNQIKRELFLDKIQVYLSNGNLLELPKGSTPIDLAFKLNPNIGNTMIRVIVNGQDVPSNYKLKHKDRIKILTDQLSYGPREEWLNYTKTAKVKKLIKEFNLE